MLPTYSVVIPAYNCEKFVVKTITSVLDQTVPPLKIIIVDDCSTDNTRFVLNSFEENLLVYIEENKNNLGVAKSRNIGMSFAQGDFVAFIDADDLWHPNKMKIQLKALQDNHADFSCIGYSFINENNQTLIYSYQISTLITLKSLLKENAISLSASVINSEIAKEYKFSSEYMHEAYLFWLFVLKDGKKGIGINQPLMIYRIHPRNRSGDKKKGAKNRWKIYRNFLHLSPITSAYYFL